MTNSELDLIVDTDERERVSARISSVLHRTPTAFSLIKTEGWIATPLERSMHLSPRTRERIVERLLAQGSQVAYAVSFEIPGVFTPIFCVPVSTEGLTAFDMECGQLNYVLYAENFCGFILCSASGDYLAIVGVPDFVEAIAGSGLTEARSEFEQFAESPAWTPAERSLFHSVVKALCEEYIARVPGAEVVFPRT